MAERPLDNLLDRIIAELLAHRVMRVVVSGEDLTTLPATLDCLQALSASGYVPLLAFSHSAAATLQSACLDGLAQRGIDALCDNRDLLPAQADYCGLYLPALSSNSLSKIALGIRDNLVCRWAFHALSHNRQIFVTLNGDVLHGPAGAFQARLTQYAHTLVEYGFTVIGLPPAEQRLVTLSDVRLLPAGQPIHIGRGTLITPAARDEIRDRGIAIVQPSRG